MKRSVCVFALVMLCMGFVVCAGNEDAFFKGDFYGVSWGMTKKEVMKAFAGDVIYENALADKDVRYLYKERGEIVYVDFNFYNDEDSLESVEVKASTNGMWRTTCTLEYIAWHTNRLVQRFGSWKDKKISEFNYTDADTGVIEKGIGTSLGWDTPRMSVSAYISVSTNGTGNIGVSTSYYPRRRYLQ